MRKWMNRTINSFEKWWTHFWARRSGRTRLGRLAARFASWFAPPHKDRVSLAKLNPNGYIEPTAQIYHNGLELGKNVFIGDRVIIYQALDGGPVRLGDRVTLLRDTIIETGKGGSLTIGEESYIHPRCQMNAHKGSIYIGKGVMVAANSAFYPHNHGVAPDLPIRFQPLESKGDIYVGDEAWIGTGVIVLGGVRIGEGAVVGAGSVVINDVPDGAIAVGVPARVVKHRSEISEAEVIADV